MKLDIWMKKNGKNDATLAGLVGCDRITVSRWRKGLKRPDWKNLDKLAEVTKGKVTAADFVKSEVAA